METNSPNLFDSLLTAKQDTSLNFNFNKLLKANNSRKTERTATNGTALIYNEAGELIAKAEITDISSHGVRVKTSVLNIEPGTLVKIEIVKAGIKIEPISCIVRWISAVDYQLRCNEMGIQFAVIIPALKLK